MISFSSMLDVECLSEPTTREALIREVQNGLLAPPRSLKPWMFYDELGSQLFEQITALPEYYPTRCERSILALHADAIMAAACLEEPRPLRVIELGAGTAAKTDLVLEAAVSRQIEVVYVPLDVSTKALDVACRRIASTFPEVLVEPAVVNYVNSPPQLDPFEGASLALYLGSSIGNFLPEEARMILRNLRSQLRSGDAFVLGTDLVKDEPTLMAAYDDKEGVTAAFNLNILNRLNRELDANFDPAGFRHLARWNPQEARMEMHLESVRDQSVRIAAADLELYFREGETIHTENSYKFTDEALEGLLEGAGFAMESTWKDVCGWCAVTLARPRETDACD